MAVGVVERCDECGFEAAGLSADDAIAEIAATPERWKLAMAGLTGHEISARPPTEQWSIADYVDHARGVVYSSEVLILVATGRPGDHVDGLDAPPSPGSTDVVDIRSSWERLRSETAAFVARLESLLADGWDDEAALVNGEILSVPTMLHHAVHDLRHHLADVQRLRESLAA